MNTTLREVLARQASDAVTPGPDLETLVGLGESRLRRRRLTALLGITTAIVVVVALSATLTGPVKRSEAPVDRPTHSPGRLLQQPVREIVYSDTRWAAGNVRNRAVHLGDQVVATGAGVVHLDVTDDGFVYTRHGRAWFSDGGTPEPIGSHLCGAAPNGEFLHFAHHAVMSANTGSLVAWFECTRADRAGRCTSTGGSTEASRPPSTGSTSRPAT